MDDSIPSSPLSYRLTCRLYRDLEAALIDQCARHYDTGILLRGLDLRRVEAADDTTVLTLELVPRGKGSMRAQLMVSRMGYATFDVFCRVEQGTSRRLTCRLPTEQVENDDRFTGPRLRALGRDLATFLRTELETRIGRRVLEQSGWEPASVSAPETSDPAGTVAAP
jgi:hypothetical protein